MLGSLAMAIQRDILVQEAWVQHSFEICKARSEGNVTESQYIWLALPFYDYSMLEEFYEIKALVCPK